MKVYLDNAATTPLAEEVFEAMAPVLKTTFGNPSSTHSYGREVRGLVETARRSIAKMLNVTPGEITFTSGGTEADNMAIKGAVHDLGVKTIITSTIEHHAVLHTVEELEKEGVKVHYVQLDADGAVDLNDLEKALQENENCLVSLMHANNEVGNLLPLEKVGEMCRQYGAYFHSDTVQTMGHYPFDLQEIPVDFITGAAHKFHGPKGIGFLYINKRLKIQPLIHGGSQERSMRAGTENVYGIVGLAKALELCNEEIEEHKTSISGIKQYMIGALKTALPEVAFNGKSASENESLYTVLSVSLPPTDKAGMLLFNLDIKGVACSGGSACSSGSNLGSHVLRGIQAKADRPSVRFSFSRYTTKEDVDYAVQCLKDIYTIQ
ncbi:MAG: cysteine desulfurase [Crocinitomicaceae bacterium]|nr:cysteine desulfurase [Crocinitomicaceae bacterium]|tara:strand:+ start:11912 stop:13045 length:1134 start_codon:yes stop_codon:yes gene_type:complete